MDRCECYNERFGRTRLCLDCALAFLADMRPKIIHGVPGMTIPEQRLLWELAANDQLPKVPKRTE